MSLTLEQRRDINLQNSRKSTGPKTAQGKANSRKNAIKHGLRSEVLALPNEDPVKIAERAASWNDYYHPRSPSAQHLVNECVQATILADRIHQFHHFALSTQIRDAKPLWLAEREDQVKKLKDLMNDDPAEAVRLLKRSSHGVCSLIMEWEGFQKRFAGEGCLNGTDCDHAISLLGCRPALEDMIHHPGAYLLCLFNALAHQAPSEACLEALCEPRNVPPSLLSTIKAVSHRPPEECRIWIKSLFKQELAALLKLADSLEENDALEFNEAENRALILKEETAARLFLRYHAESRNAFHRAFNKLEKTLLSDAVSESCLEAEAPNEPISHDWADIEAKAPNEPDSRNWADAEAETGSPNEANLDTRNWADVEVETVSPNVETGSPNEADLDAREPDSDQGMMGKLKPAVMGLLLIVLLFSARFATATTYPNEADPGRDVIAVNEAAAMVYGDWGWETRSAAAIGCVHPTHPFATMKM